MSSLLLQALACWLAFLGVAIAVYLAGSFLLMRPHVPPRPLARTLRQMLRELWHAAATQPALPLFYLPPSRMGRGRGGTPVVLVHGYSQNRVDFVRLAAALSRAPCGPLHGFNYPWVSSIGANARRLGAFVDEVCGREGAPQVDLVCHSIGGLVALEYLRAHGHARVRRCVTIASPHAGVVFRGPIPGACGREIRRGSEFLARLAQAPLPVPVLSVYSPHDNVVHPAATSSLAARGGTDRALEDCGHLGILFDARMCDAVAAFLAAGQPVPAAEEPARTAA